MRIEASDARGRGEGPIAESTTFVVRQEPGEAALRRADPPTTIVRRSCTRPIFSGRPYQGGHVNCHPASACSTSWFPDSTRGSHYEQSHLLFLRKRLARSRTPYKPAIHR